eukprot:1158400-Pelagomonas_calceolata.AAC.8
MHPPAKRIPECAVSWVSELGSSPDLPRNKFMGLPSVPPQMFRPYVRTCGPFFLNFLALFLCCLMAVRLLEAPA